MDALSNRLTLLRDRIVDNLKIDDAWPRRNHQVCVDLVEARDQFKDNASFHKWLDEGAIKMSHQDRAAAITMGREPDKLLDVLTKTARRSLRHIHANEWGSVTHAGKTTRQGRDTEEFNRALRVVQRRAQAGETLGYRDIEEEAEVSSIPVRRALAAHEAVAKEAKEVEIALSGSAQEKFDAKLRAYKKQIDLDFETAVRTEARKRSDELELPHYFKKLEAVESLLNSPRFAVMPIAHFKQILACLHPDNARPGHEERFQEAFTLFNGYKPKMVDMTTEKEEKDRRKRVDLRGAPLPRTIEEMLARKRSKARA